MGTSFSVQNAITNIKNNVSNVVEQTSDASANITCNIKVGSFEFKNTTNCTGTVTNKCSAQASIKMEAVIDASINVFNNLTNEQKQGVPGWFQQTFGISTTVNNVTSDFQNIVRQKCSAESIVSNSQTFDTIKIENCVSTQGVITFEFLNTGEATSVCAMELVTKLGVAAVSDIKNTQSSGIDFNALIWPIVIVLGIVSIIYILITVVNKKILNPEDQAELLKYKTNTYATRLSILKSVFNK